ncbi:cyclin-A2-4-like isoform X1 [Juglans regia]|nr:cyclin-A2-4-like isoform X1 [Juglans regia]
MRKENLVTAKSREPTAPLTRARAAAFRASGQLPPLKAPIPQTQKRNLRGNSKGTDLDENNNHAPGDACLQHKRRAVFQDITNNCCTGSYRNCLNATKIQAKNRKSTNKGQIQVSKVAPSVALERPQFQAGSKTNILQEKVEVEPKSKEVISSIDLKESVPLLLSIIKEHGLYDHQLEFRSSGVPSHLQSSPKIVKDGPLGDMILSSNPEVLDIDADYKEPQSCSVYAPEIYNHLRVAELARRPSPNYMKTIQHDITQSMRGILVDWLVEVAEEYNLVPDTLYLTVHLIDSFLTQNYIERQRLQLLGITCMLISSKYEEICAPHVEELCLITDNTYTRKEVLELEIRVLKYFGFQVFAPTAKTFLRRSLRAAVASYKTPSLEMEYLANYLAELTLIDNGFLDFLPSMIAASAVFLARWTLDQSSHPWNPTLEHYTSYKASDLKYTVLAMQDLQLNTDCCPLSAIRMKYRQQKQFKSVAALSSPKLLETLF